MVFASNRVLLVALLCAGCLRAAPNHQKVGDQAYVDGAFGDALVEYRLALVLDPENADLRAKAAIAALKGGALEAAAEEYVALALAGGEGRRDEAADGLVRVADRAIEDANGGALGLAIAGLNDVAPGRALGSFAGQLAGSLEGQQLTEDALDLVTFAAAGASNARTQDSLMFVYGSSLRRLGRCRSAVPVFESLVRRQRDPRVVAGARGQLSLCALAEGRRALRAGSPADAERWFRRAVAGSGNTPQARAAYIGLGDVMLAQGDYFGAVDALVQAMDGLAPGDSLYDIADQRLRSISDASRRIPR